MSENKSRLDKSIWTSRDGHHHTSIPTTVPERWTRSTMSTDLFLGPLLVYVSGDYKIRRYPYVGKRFTYVLFRNGVAITLGGSTLKDVKERAVRNARGEDVVNVA